MTRVPIPPGDKEFKYKEQLYALFYELTSEVKGKDIELEEEEYINNINTIKFSELMSYLREIIQILINKQHETAKTINNKLNDEPFIENDWQVYERIIQHYEAKERKLLRRNHELKTIKEINEICLNDYHQMEGEFTRMKDQVKYEEGRFLKNERKDNEIIIIRQENAILKKTIAELEEKSNINDNDIKNMNKEIKKLKESIKLHKSEIDKLITKIQKGSNISNNPSWPLSNNKSLDKSPSKSNILKLVNMKSIIQYNQNHLNKSMGLNANANLIDVFTNKTLSTHKNPNHQPNPGTNVILNMTRDSSLVDNFPFHSKKQQQRILKPYCMKVSMMPHNHNQSRSPRTNIDNLSSKRNQLSSRISLSKKPSGPLTNKSHYKVSLNSSKG